MSSIITVTVTFVLPHDNRTDCALLVQDAISEFAAQRREAYKYVGQRYPEIAELAYCDMLAHEARSRNVKRFMDKVREVKARVAAAIAVDTIAARVAEWQE